MLEKNVPFHLHENVLLSKITPFQPKNSPTLSAFFTILRTLADDETMKELKYLQVFIGCKETQSW